MSSANSTDGYRIRNAIESFLNELSRATGPSGFPVDRIVCRSHKDGGEVRTVGYVHRDDTIFGDEGKTIIVLPSKPAVTLDEGLSLLDEHRASTSCRRMFFVDCFSTCDDSSTGMKEYLTSDALWNHIFGGRLNPFSTGYDRENTELLLDVDRGYRPRVLLLSGSRTSSCTGVNNEEDLIPMDGAALELLSAWAVSYTHLRAHET